MSTLVLAIHVFGSGLVLDEQYILTKMFVVLNKARRTGDFSRLSTIMLYEAKCNLGKVKNQVNAPGCGSVAMVTSLPLRRLLSPSVPTFAAPTLQY